VTNGKVFIGLFCEFFMRIMHITDIHGDTEHLAKAVNHSNERGVNVLACSGDLLGQTSTVEEARQMQQAYNFVLNNVRVNGRISVDDLFKRLRGDANAPEEIKRAVEIYATLEQAFDTNANRQYEGIDSALKDFSGKLILVPGNWDTVRQLANYDHLQLNNIHEASLDVGGIKFSGHGGAHTIPIFTPPTRIDGFSEERLFTTMKQNDPEVAVLHVPPYGILDMDDEGTDHIGSFAARSYVFEESPNLLLCGHAHRSLGIQKAGGGDAASVVVNSGNLGRYSGAQRSGTFTEIELGENNYVKSVQPWMTDGKDIATNGEKIKFFE
jgi:Icc-related predicted phosphoesterase